VIGVERKGPRRRRGRTRMAVARAFGLAPMPVLGLALGLVVSGCSSDGLSGRSSAPASSGATGASPSFGDRISNLFGNQPAAPSQPQAPGQVAILPDDFECPTVDIRLGTSTFAVSAAGVDPSPMSLRYQASFGQTARECKLAGNTLTIKVGIEGRVVLGPAGGPGQIDVPVRYAVVEEGPDPKTIVTKVHWQSITISPGETNVPFTQVEEELSFPMPRGKALESYIVYVGFDSAVAKEPVKKKPPEKKPDKKPPRRAPG
jgi:hypothetical protein